MSYCRWSSDDWQCDVYVWADVSGGWCTEVAGRRFVFDVPLPERVELPHPFTDEQFHAWWTRAEQVMEMQGDEQYGHWYELPEPDGGRSYWHGAPGECADNLERLREAGLNVPQGAIDALREEEAEAA